MLPITARVIYDRKNGGQQNLNNIKISKLCELSSNLELKFIGEDEAMALFASRCNLVVSNEVRIEDHPTYSTLQQIEPKKYVRGKYELAFFVAFINKLVETLKGERDQYGKSIKVSTMISEVNALEILGPRMIIPDSLSKFLESNLSRAA